MSGKAMSGLMLGAALLAGPAGAAEPGAREPDSLQLPAELRDTLPGGSRLGDAPELPHASVDVLPRPTQVRILVRRQSPPPDPD